LAKLSRSDRKIMGVITHKISGVKFDIKKITPGDCLGKDGIPISQWQMEAEKFYDKQKENSLTLSEIRKSWESIFKKAIVGIDNEFENIENKIEKLLGNFMLANKVYSYIIEHSLAIKKKKTLNIFQRIKP
jgi:hypothetical protein|tara:strand:+ start:4178 stop:4570 length:393 start_codon:yes stop_codon:yes gene_type:complete